MRLSPAAIDRLRYDGVRPGGSQRGQWFAVSFGADLMWRSSLRGAGFPQSEALANVGERPAIIEATDIARSGHHHGKLYCLLTRTRPPLVWRYVLLLRLQARGDGYKRAGVLAPA